MHYILRCHSCEKILKKEPVYECPECGGIVDVEYDLRGKTVQKEELLGVFQYARYLPLTKDASELSIGEGSTPLVRAKKGTLGFGNLYFKLESSNPTGSFKDRGLCVVYAKARELGIEEIAIASSGNASASAAAYSARANRRTIAIVPEATPKEKVAQALFYGAEVLRVPGSYSNSYAYCKELAEKKGFMNATTTFINPYAKEGYKTIGYEIVEQLKRAPDWILIPVGAGPVLAAVYRAFSELLELGATTQIPRLVCVQASACAPIARAFLLGRERVEAEEQPKQTIASGINDGLVGYTRDGEYTLRCIRKSGGTAVMLQESEIEQATCELAEQGIYAEPAGAVGMGALQKLRHSDVIKKEDTVVVLVTGTGFKNPLPPKKKGVLRTF